MPGLPLLVPGLPLLVPGLPLLVPGLRMDPPAAEALSKAWAEGGREPGGQEKVWVGRKGRVAQQYSLLTPPHT